MNGDIRTMLQEKAEEMKLEQRIPARVVKRARRRRVVTATVASAVTLAAAVGFYAGARTLLDETPGPSPGQDVHPAGGSASAPIWPTTEAEIRAIQSQVAEGHMPLWQSPEGVAQMYAVNVLGWDPDDVGVRVAGDQPVTAIIANPTMSQAAGVAGDVRTALTLARVPDTDEGIYVVARAEAEEILLENPAPGAPVVPGGTVAFSGSLSLQESGLTVDLGVQWESGSVGAEVANPRSFRLDFLLPGDVESAPVVWVNVRDASGLVLGVTEFRLSLSEDGQALPSAVTATRDAIEEAARLRDWEALERLIPETRFTHNFGGDTDPIGYYQDLERDGVQILDILATLLELAPGRFGGTYTWPAPAAEIPQDWDQEDLDILRQVHTEREIREFQRFDLYFGWRVGIEADGTWVFFVAGD